MSVYDHSINALDGEPFDLAGLSGNVTLLVNVASRCGFTPQYGGLEELHKQYGSRGFSVLGLPCNQFGGQEPGTPEEIADFCQTNYGVTFPLTEKVEVNGPGRHPLYQELTQTPDADGEAGDIKWNFEKFLVSRDGQVVARFRSGAAPGSPEVVSAIEKAL